MSGGPTMGTTTTDLRFSTAKLGLMAASAWLLLRRLGAYAWLAYLSVRAHTRAWLGLGLAAGSSQHHGPKAYRIYAFDEDYDGGADAARPAASDDEPRYYIEIPVAGFDPDHWEADVARATGWTSFRVEIRYTFRTKKYRMVLHRGDACTFPPYTEPAAPACRLPKGVLSARLLGPLGSDVECDVTSRVMKYQGPRGDFHAGLGLRVNLHDMFPFDDHEDNNARFAFLRLMDTRGQLHDLVVRDNPPVVASPPVEGPPAKEPPAKEPPAKEPPAKGSNATAVMAPVVVTATFGKKDS